MYISQINPTTNFGYTNMLEKAPKLLEISLLKKISRICPNKKVDRNLLQKKQFTSYFALWVPLWGNVVNAVTAGYTTKTFGYALVDECERIRKAKFC